MVTHPEINRIGRYTIIERLGYGGTAAVFIAQREGDNKVCVIKRLHAKFERHPIALKRLVREATLATYLDHPNIARMLGAGFEDGRFVVAFEFVAGQTVEALMRVAEQRGMKLPLDVCLAIAYPVLAALDHAHNCKDSSGRPLDIVHRDLSPRNILVGYDGVVKLIDFGVARARSDDGLTQPGMLVGTLRYLSPEQALTDPVDQRSDVYTLGVVLWEMISGRELVKDGAPTDILRRVVTKATPALSGMDREVPRAFDAVLERAMTKDPKLRFATARAFKDALVSHSDLPRPCSTKQLGALMRDLFPEGLAWSAGLAASAQKNARAHDTTIFDHSITPLTSIDIGELGDLREIVSDGSGLDISGDPISGDPISGGSGDHLPPPPKMPSPKTKPRTGPPTSPKGVPRTPARTAPPKATEPGPGWTRAGIAMLAAACVVAILGGLLIQRMLAASTGSTTPIPVAPAHPHTEDTPESRREAREVSDMDLPPRLSRKVAALLLDPKDDKLFDEVVTSIREESKYLPKEPRHRVEWYLDEANRSRSYEELKKALLVVGSGTKE